HHARSSQHFQGRYPILFHRIEPAFGQILVHKNKSYSYIMLFLLFQSTLLFVLLLPTSLARIKLFSLSFFLISYWNYSLKTQLYITVSVINGKGTPNSSALMLVHLPVPFCPALSKMTSTIGCFVSSSFFVKISAVISIK